MEVYGRGSEVQYAGWANNGVFSIFGPAGFGKAYWWYWVTYEITYRNKQRYLHITHIKVKGQVTINSEVHELAYAGGYCDLDGVCVDIYEEKVYFRDLSNCANNIPSNVTLNVGYTTGNGYGAATGWHSIGSVYLGNFMSQAFKGSIEGPQNKQATGEADVNFEMLLTNDPCHLNFLLRGYGTDWGIIQGLWFERYVPNTPGTQYYTGSKWETHRIKRWNGSQWLDIPGRRWNGSIWDEIQG